MKISFLKMTINWTIGLLMLRVFGILQKNLEIFKTTLMKSRKNKMNK